jgi:protein-tyrosine phosphatase
MTDVHEVGDIVELMRSIDTDRRRVPVDGTLNFRDAGGYPVEGGGTIAWRTLFRSDALHNVGESGAGALAGLGLRTVIDLRVPEEIQIAPSPADDLAENGTRVFHLSLVGADFTELPAELEGVYSYIVDRRAAAVGAAIKSLAAPGALPALVHCTAGKDRTGIVIAFTLAAVGVPDPVIAADYALSSRYLDPEQTPVIGQIRANSGLGERLTETLMASPPQLILNSLRRARNQAGSIAGYLGRNGVTAAELSALKTALVRSEPP